MAHFDTPAGLVILPVDIEGPAGSGTYRLALDTGAATTLVNAQLLRDIGYDPATSLQTHSIVTASGIEHVPRIRLLGITALGHTRESLEVICHSLPPEAGLDGLLGLDFLRKRKLTLDFRVGEMSLE